MLATNNMGAIGTFLGIAVELGCFNQWIFGEKSNSTSWNTALLLSLVYVGFETLMTYLLKSRKIELPALQVSVLFPVHLVVASVSTLVGEMVEGDADRSREDATKSTAVHATNQTGRHFRINDIILLAFPAATAAISNAVFLRLVEQVNDMGHQTSTVAEMYAYTVFLTSRFGDYIICKRRDRSLFFFQEGAAQTKAAGLLVLQVVFSQAIISWVLGMGEYGPLGKHVVEWLW